MEEMSRQWTLKCDFQSLAIEQIIEDKRYYVIR